MALTSFRRFGPAALVALVVLVAGAPMSTSGPLDGQQNAANSDAITKLLNERRAVLKHLVDVQVDGYRKGNVELETITEARRQLLEVELELTTKRDKQVELLAAFVAIARDLEKMAGKRFEAGTVTVADVLKAQAMRLEVETELLRARQK